jgi:hypothetical protein
MILTFTFVAPTEMDSGECAWLCEQHPQCRIKGFWGEFGGQPHFQFLAGVKTDNLDCLDHIQGERVRTLGLFRSLDGATKAIIKHINGGAK